MFCEQLFATLDLNCCNPQYSWVSNMCCNVEYLLIVLFVLLLPARPGIDLILDVFWNAEIIESGLGGAAAVCSRCSTAALQRWERAGGKQMHQLAFILIAKVSLYSRSGKNHDWISSKTAANGENLRKRCHLSRKLSGERGPLLLSSRPGSEVWRLFCTHRSHNSKASFWYLTVRENFYHNFLWLKFPEKDPTTTSLLVEGIFLRIFFQITNEPRQTLHTGLLRGEWRPLQLDSRLKSLKLITC